jgi:hypothetical protein
MEFQMFVEQFPTIQLLLGVPFFQLDESSLDEEKQELRK